MAAYGKWPLRGSFGPQGSGGQKCTCRFVGSEKYGCKYPKLCFKGKVYYLEPH